MKIAFDTWVLKKPYCHSGIYNYARSLLSAFRQLILTTDRLTVYPFFLPGGFGEDVQFGVSPGVEMIDTSLMRYQRLWRIGGVAVAAARVGADVIFSPTLHISPFSGVPVVTTIHDVIAAKLPKELFPRGTSLKQTITTNVAVKLSQRILTDSQCSKDDLVELYGVEPEKISVVYLGYDKSRFNALAPEPSALGSLLARLGIVRPYVLHHGMVQLRKNLIRLIEAYNLQAERHPEFDLQLVLAGPYGWGSEQVREIGGSVKNRGRVVFTGALTDDQLALLIKGASLAVIPSLYEGFSLPMVEAMACGIPTIASNTSCLSEVSGGVLRYFDAFSVEDMADTMDKVMLDEDLRRTLVRDGLRRVAEFGWARCARETLAVLSAAHGAQNGNGKHR